MNAFIVGKVITGIANSGSYISIINIITILTAPLERGRYFGYIGFVWVWVPCQPVTLIHNISLLNRCSELDLPLEAPLPSVPQASVGASTSI